MHYSFVGKAEFSASLLQSSVSYDPSEIILIHWFSAQETFIIIIIIIIRENSLNSLILLWKSWYIFFIQDSLVTRKFKRKASIWNRNLLKQF